MRLLGTFVSFVSAAGLSCSAAHDRPRAEPPPASPSPAPVSASALRCGVDDDPLLPTLPPRTWAAANVSVVADRITADGAPASSDLVDALTDGARRLLACASLVRSEDEGTWVVRIAFAPGGVPTSAAPPPGSPTYAVRCFAERACTLRAPESLAKATTVELPIRVGPAEGRFHRAEARLVSGTTSFVSQLVVTGAEEAGTRCLAEAVPPEGAELRLLVGTTTARSLRTLRRETSVTSVTSEPVSLVVPAAVDRCVLEHLRTIRFGDRHTPAGTASYEVLVHFP